MAIGIRFQLNRSLYSRDPQDSALGRNIIKHSILLIHEIGFESFNFKKLSQEINSTEASIYRYFDNKHLLLLYLTNWYWEWANYLIEINTMNIENPLRKLKIAIRTIVHASSENPAIDYVNENILHNIVINESSKAYHTRTVDEENKMGLFLSYKEVVKRLAGIIAEVNPDFPYKKSLASNLFEMANNQIYFVQHLPRLTDLKNRAGSYEELEEMLRYFAFKLLEK